MPLNGFCLRASAGAQAKIRLFFHMHKHTESARASYFWFIGAFFVSLKHYER